MTGCVAPACTSACAEPSPTPVSPARQFGRAVAVVLTMSVGAVLVTGLTCWPGRHKDRRAGFALQHVSRWVLRAAGAELVVAGAPRSGPSLVVGNHTSWLDILAVSASAPMRMVAKSEVGQWPLIGRVARRTGTLFVHRDRLRQLPDAVAAIAAALRSGSRVQVFPEATTRCGGALDPFRRAPFQAAIDAAVVVSPVAISYFNVGRATAVAAFVGNDDLFTSVRRVLATPALTVEVSWLAPIPAIAGTGRDRVDRAIVARLAQQAVARKLGVPVLSRRVGQDVGPRSRTGADENLTGADEMIVAAVRARRTG